MAKKKWAYRSPEDKTGEGFALSQTWNKQKPGNYINFWHITSMQVALYTFEPNAKYNTEVMWSKKLCRELEADLRSPAPSVRVIRFAVNGTIIFADENNMKDELPKPPEHSMRSPVSRMGMQSQDTAALMHRRRVEEAKGKEPAPYILYGTHGNYPKEYAWSLNPDKPKRQGIVPGDRVLAWTQKGFAEIAVTRIEEIGDREQPTARVKKKLTPKEQSRKKPQK